MATKSKAKPCWSSESNQPTVQQKYYDTEVFFIDGSLVQDSCSDIEIIALRNPSTEKVDNYLFAKHLSIFYEIMCFNEEPRSWFINDVVQPNGHLYITSAFDPLFWGLYYLRSNNNEKCLPIEQTVVDDDLPNTHLIADHLTSEQLSMIGDPKGDKSLKAFKYNETKALTWLEIKFENLMATLREKNFHIGAKSVHCVKSDKFVDPKQNNDGELLSYAFGIISEYITVDLSEKLSEHLGLKKLTPAVAGKRKSMIDSVHKPLKQIQSLDNISIVSNKPTHSPAPAVKEKEKKVPTKDKQLAKLANSAGAGENKSSTPQKFFSPATWNLIQRDRNSPSASCRFRAIRAMRSPTNSYYYNTSDDPQNVDKSVEEKVPEYPKTIQEVMKNVSVYVEIRSATDNRTAGVKSVIAKLGAKVMERLTKNTTHVVFKDGLQTTYNKAKRCNIPIVSILWIEACKRHLVLMDPKEYPISNLDMYENPDLYSQQTIPKRQKCIQPEALMKNLHRKISKAKLLQGLKKMDESKNSSVSTSLASAKTLNTTTKSAQPKRLSTTFKVTTIRKSVGPKTEVKQHNTIRSMFEKQAEKSRIENSQANESLNEVANDSVVSEDTVNQSSFSEPEIETVPPLGINPQKDGTEATEGKTNTTETPTDETVLVTGNLHNRLTRRNSISISTPTKTSPNKATPQKKTGNTAILLGSARKRHTLFIPTMNATVEETEQNLSLAKNDTTPNKTINECVPMEICANPNAKKCNSLVRQLLDTELVNTPIAGPNRSVTENRKDLLKSTFRRRNTVYTPQPMDETKARGSTITPFSSPRRKTMIPRGASKIKPLNSSPPEMAETQSCDAVLTPASNSIADKRISNLNSSTSSLVTTPLLKSMSQIHLDLIRKSTSKSLLDEYTNTFNSKKDPLSSKRRTMGNTAMDIIKQRVENINRNVSFNQSMSEALDDAMRDTPTQSKHIKSTTEPNEAVNAETEKPKPQGRRLFAPPSLFPPDNSFLSMATPPKTDKKAANKSALKRKRNELLSAEKPAPTADDKKLKKPQKSRRSTLFFEDAPIKKTNHLAKVSSDTKNNKAEPIESTESTQNHTVAKNATPVLVCTSMHQPQIAFINEAVQKLGTFKLEDKVGAMTTHLVSFDTRRTINLLRGLIRGIWIVNYDWILRSVESNKWLPEVDYELKAFSKAVEINRIERQAFGNKYRMDIFRNFKQFYISSNCVCKNLRELITQCYGKVTADKASAHYIIDEKYRNDCTNKNAYQVQANWILDSISAGKVAKIEKYILKTAS